MDLVMGDDTRLKALGVAVSLLTAAAVDLDDPAEEAAYYAHAHTLMMAIIATPARDFAGCVVKAEAVAWCVASRTNLGFGATAQERILNSLMRDLLDSRD